MQNSIEKQTSGRILPSNLVPTLANCSLNILCACADFVETQNYFCEFAELPEAIRWRLTLGTVAENNISMSMHRTVFTLKPDRDILIYVGSGSATYTHEFSRQWLDRIDPPLWVFNIFAFPPPTPAEYPVSLAFFLYLKTNFYRMLNTPAAELKKRYLNVNPNSSYSCFVHMFKDLPDECDYAGDFFRLLRSGDVELNPGPVMSTPYVHTCYNDPRGARFDDGKKGDKVRTILANIRRDLKRERQGIHCQVFSEVRSFLKAPEKISKQAEQIISFFENQLPQMEKNMINLVHTSIAKASHLKRDISLLILITLLVFWLMQQKYKRSALIVILSAVAYFCHLPREIVEIIQKIKNLLTSEANTIESQGFSETILYSPWFGLCGQLLFAAMAFIGIKAIPGKKDWDNYIMRLDRIPKAVEGSKKISAICTEYFNLAADQLKILILKKEEAELGHVHKLYKEVKEWAKEVRLYTDLTERRKIDSDADLANRVQSFYRRGLYFKSKDIPDQKIAHLISATLFPAKLLYEYVAMSPIKGGGLRSRAVTIWISGESGIGKTLAVYPLCIDLLKKMGYKSKEYNAAIYPRMTETEFWDGYHDQKIVVYDDAFQRTDDKLNPNPELFEVIRSCNEFPQHVHMAALQDKNTYCSAEVLIYTSNDRNIKINSLTHPDAFHGRMNDNAYNVYPAPGYEKTISLPNGGTKVVLDKTKLNPDTAIDLNAYHFQKMERNPLVTTGDPWVAVGEPIGFEEFSQRMCDAWSEQARRGHAIRKFCDERMISCHMADDEVPTRPPRTPRAQRKSRAPDVPIGRHGPEDSPALMDLSDEILENYGTVEQLHKLFELDIAIKAKKGMDMEAIEYEYSTRPYVYTRYLAYRDNLGYTDDRTKWEKFSDHITGSLQALKLSYENTKKRISEIFREHPILSILGVLGTVVAAFGIYEAIQYMRRDDEDEAVVEVNNSGDDKTRNQQRIQVHVATERKKLKSQIESQGCNDQAAYNIATDLLYRNTYQLSYMVNDERKIVGNCTFVTGWCFIMPYHFIETFQMRDLPPNTALLFSSQHHEDVMQIPLSFLYYSENNEVKLTNKCQRMAFSSGDMRDCVLVNCVGMQIHPHKNILHHFIRQADLSKFVANGSVPGTLMSYRRDPKQRLGNTYIWLMGIKPTNEAIEINYPQGLAKTHYLQRESYQYESPTMVGDCGAITVVFSNRMDRKLIGMHIAGSKSTCKGYSVPLTQEVLEQALNAFDKTGLLTGISAHACFEPPNVADVTREPEMPDGVFIPLGKSTRTVGASSKTKLLRSCLYGKLRPVTMAPAILAPKMVNGVMIDPLTKALQKCGGRTKLLDLNHVEIVANDVANTVLRCYNSLVDRKKFQRILEYEEAVMGTHDDDYMRAICRSTSPGFPYTLDNKGSAGKTRWMGTEETFDFTSSLALQLRSDVEHLLENCQRGILTDVVWVDTKKDEKRDLAKVEQIKTRSFAAGPQHFIIAFRMYYLPFAAWLMHNRIDNEMALGSNVFSIDWHLLAKRLQQKGKQVFAGDFSNFDGSLNAQLLWAMFEHVFTPWLASFVDLKSEEGLLHYRTAMSLWAHVVHSVHIYDDNLYMWTHSQPSGNPYTTVINCLYNMMIMRMAWIVIMEEKAPQLKSMQDFNKHVNLITYGDDNVGNVSDDVGHLYNQVTISAAMDKLGHTYTDETKTGEAVKFRQLDEINFLKRGFRYSEEFQRYIAPLKIEVIYEMLNWTKNVIDPNSIVMDNIDVAFREIILHGRTAFQDMKNDIESVEHHLPFKPRILTYGEYADQFRTGENDTYRAFQSDINLME